jgi:PAS domain S-box-containing protein
MLNESHQKYQEIANNFSDVIWVLEVGTLTYYYVSPSVAELRGFESNEVIGKSLEDVLTPDSYQKAMKIFKQKFKEYEKGLDPKVRMEIQVVHKDGPPVWVEFTARFFRYAKEPLLLLGISRDINARKILEKEREELIVELETALEEKKRLLKENKVLRGLLPICAEGKRIRDKDGVWHDLETYIAEHSEAKFTHTICPRCTAKLYPGLELPESS